MRALTGTATACWSTPSIWQAPASSATASIGPRPQDDEPSPFGPFLAEVDDYLQGRQAGEPYRGYSFRVLTGQGPQAPGGAYSYVINGNMVAGFALFAWPAEYGDSGVMSFLVGNDGVVLETDLGPDTAERARAITAYDPDPAWRRSTD